MYIYTYIHVYMYIYRERERCLGKGDDTIRIPHRAQLSPFELFEVIFLVILDRQLPVERFKQPYLGQQHPPPPLQLC